MKRKTLILLILIIVLPMMLLAWFGVRMQQDQQQVVAYQFKNLVDSRLQGIDQQFQNHFFALQQLFIPQAAQLQQQTAGQYQAHDIRQFIKRSAFVQQVFVISDAGERLFPPTDQSLNQQERTFVELTRKLLESPERFTMPVADPQQVSAATAKQPFDPSTESESIFSARLSAPAAQESLYSSADQTQRSLPAHGWIAWYAETGLRHIFWVQDSAGNTVGFALNSARLLSDLINLLPDSSVLPDAGISAAEIQLINNRGEINYSWGDLSAVDEQMQPQQVLPLSHPLASWRLSYFGTDPQPLTSGWIGLAALILLLTAGLSVLAYLLYRDHSRELRLAEQRVNFVNQVSHELKTPLTNVRLYTEMLEQELDEEEIVAQRYLNVIGSEAGRLSRLIENVLSFSRSKREDVSVRYQKGVVDDCVNQVVELFTPVLSARHLTMRFTGQADHLCQFDGEALEQILNNLLSNCEKYAADGKFVDIYSWQKKTPDGLYSYIRISDFGPGVSALEADKLFEPFYRGSDKLTEGVSGTGIGLGLARDLARAHQGDLVVEEHSVTDSTAGASFLLTLLTPLADVAEVNSGQADD
ncbi:sensor histidine kinase [Amphritea balenae]|uniref:histidine kinase n=1 Tax=Amphritea balenae TaxID=452629 RepID=A0A3P1SRR8_9GAMM|nr:HAMP domain-containing sensor histidine kinase [Amphritea balenae]RRC99604.1 sensor histidine kinase [Amphritea balenae]GGK78352.1 hypothetical protein GCM10007941_30660 [Amphritea balenae]